MATITPGQQADPFGIYVAPGKTAEEAIAGGIFNTPADAEKAGYKFYYQPTTPTNTTVVNDPIITEPTVKDAYGDYLITETPEDKAYRLEMERQQKLAEGLAMGEVDEATIRANTEKQFQAEIDALNRVYAEKKRQLAVEGQGRVGSATSVQARRGLIGSDFGSAQTEKVKQYNQQIIDEAEAERAAKEANIWARARNAATVEYQSKLAAKQQGAEAYLEFLKGAAERKSNTIKQTIANMLSQGVDPDSLDSDGLAKELGISVAELKRQYNSAKSEAESAASKAAQEGAFTLGEGQLRYDAQGNLIAAGTEKKDYPASVQEYEYAKAGGYTGSFTDYQNEDANRKMSIAKASIAGVDPTVANIALKMGEKFDASPIVKQFNEVQNKKLGIDKLLSGNQTGPGDVALIYDFMKALDPTSVVRESEYAMGAKSGNIFTGALAQFNGVFKQSGGKLSEQVKRDMKNIINQRYGAITQQYNNLYNETARKMQGYGVTDPDMFITDYTGAESSKPSVNKRYNDVNSLINENPQTQEWIDNYLLSNPNATDQDILNELSPQPFNSVGNTSASNYLKNYGAVTGEGSPYWKWGLDVDLKKGDPVFSPVSGVVVQAGDNKDGFGNRVGIKTAQGNIVYLSHLDGVNAKVGQTVSKNQLVGKGGNTGKVIAVGGGDGSHLDITVKKPDGSYYTAAEVRQRLS